VTKVFANDHDATLASNDFALIANLLNAWINLHVFLPRYLQLFFTYFLLITYSDK
jgi:hypothetical protein